MLPPISSAFSRWPTQTSLERQPSPSWGRWPSGLTLCITLATLPSASITKVERLTPQYVLPPNFFSPQTPYSSATSCSGSASSVNGSEYFSLNFVCDASSSGLTPSTTAPRCSNSEYASRKPHASTVHPG